MKKLTMLQFILLVFPLMLMLCSDKRSAQRIPLTTKYDTIGYLIGQDMVASLYDLRHDITIDPFIQGFRDEYLDNKLQLERMEMQRVMSKFFIRNARKENMKIDSIQKAFLINNKKQNGIITTASGLQYRVLNEGSGPRPGFTDSVKIRYTGMLIDSSVFDTTNEPIIIKIDKVIKGWAEVLQLMKTGSTYNVYIPGELGFGPVYSAEAKADTDQSVSKPDYDSLNFWEDPDFSRKIDTTLAKPGLRDTTVDLQTKPRGMILYKMELLEIM